MNDCKIIFFVFVLLSIHTFSFRRIYVHVYFVVCMFFFLSQCVFFPVVIIRFSVLLLL